MLRTFFNSKIHHATVTDTHLDYQGSLTIDLDLLEQSGICPFEQIQVLNLNNGERFITYAIEGKRGSGAIEVNGSAARLCHKGDHLIIISYCQIDQKDIAEHTVTVLHVDANNAPTEVVKHNVKKV